MSLAYLLTTFAISHAAKKTSIIYISDGSGNQTHGLLSISGNCFGFSMGCDSWKIDLFEGTKNTFRYPVTGWWNGNNSCRLPYIFLGLVLGAGPIINTHTNAVSIISLYPIPSERPSKVYLEKMMNFLSKELLTCFVGGVMRFYHRFHVILAFTLTAYGSSITYASIYVYILPTTYLYAFWSKD